MALKAGDVVTLSVAPAVQLTQYTYLKPSARITRTLGEDVDGDMELMQRDLRKLVIRSASLELGLISDLTEALQNGDINAYIEKELDNGNQGPRQQRPGPVIATQAESPGSKGPTRKGPVRKA